MKAPCLMLGDYREPALTQDSFTTDGWLRTGDQGELDAEGNLRITGRVKDLFKTFKVKRKRIEALYAARCEGWSGRGRAVVWAGSATP